MDRDRRPRTLIARVEGGMFISCGADSSSTFKNGKEVHGLSTCRDTCLLAVRPWAIIDNWLIRLQCL